MHNMFICFYVKKKMWLLEKIFVAHAANVPWPTRSETQRSHIGETVGRKEQRMIASARARPGCQANTLAWRG